MEQRDEFINQTQGYVGAIQFKRNGDEHGIGIAPGARVWLTHDEQIATANAPQDPKDNPFIAQPYKDYDSKTGEVIGTGVREPLKRVTEARELAGVRPVGSYAAGDTGHIA